jgi:hypothetical protein
VRAFSGLRFMASMALMALFMSGCAGLMHRRPVPWALPKVGDGHIPSRWVQSVSLERDGRSLQLLAVIETDGKELTLVGLSPMGQRLVRITWADGKVAQEQDPNVPVHIDAESILRDVVFVNWPPESLQSVFAKTGWKAVFEGPRRDLSWEGRPWLSVKPELDGSMTVDHLVEGYKVHVSTVEQE